MRWHEGDETAGRARASAALLSAAQQARSTAVGAGPPEVLPRQADQHESRQRALDRKLAGHELIITTRALWRAVHDDDRSCGLARCAGAKEVLRLGPTGPGWACQRRRSSGPSAAAVRSRSAHASNVRVYFVRVPRRTPTSPSVIVT